MRRLRLLPLVLVLALLTLGLAGSAFATTTNSALWCPNVSPESTAQLGGFYISESAATSIKNGDWVSITLPSFVELQSVRLYFPGGTSYLPGTATYTVAFNDNGYSVQSAAYGYGEEASLGSEMLIQATGKQNFILKVNKDWGVTTKTFRAYIYFDQVYIKPVTPEDLESSDIKVTLDAPSTAGFSSGSVTVGKLLTAGGSTITAAAPTNITDVGGKIADITLKEDVAGTLTVNKDDFPAGNTVKLVLSPGFTWDAVTLIPQGGFGAGSVDKAVYTERNGCSALYLKIITSSSGSPGQIVVIASVKANEPFTTARDVKVTYGGTNPGVGGEKVAEVTVAKYLVSGLTVAAKSTLDAVAGRTNQQVGNFTIAEGMPGDLPKGRLISLTLPEGAKWNRLPTVTREAGNGQLAYYATRDDGRTVIYSVYQPSTSRTIFCFKNATVDLAVYAPEELSVTVKGPGVNSTATVARVQAPVEVSAAGGTVRIGAQEQAVGDLTIQENLVGALRARDAAGNRAVLKLTLPSGVRFARTPTVKVSAGDLELDAAGIKLEDNDRTLVIPVKQSSATPVEKQVTVKESSAEESTGQGESSSETTTGQEKSAGEAATEQVGSTLTVSDILLTVDRTLPEGDITLEVTGSALTETGSRFSEPLNKLTCVLAKCLTAAPVAMRGQAVFTIGSTKYTVGNEEKEMDVAPYIKDGRTYAPIRYLAYAVGLTDDNILWDGQAQTVTLIAAKRVVQFKVGEKFYLLQGVPVLMDVAPEITDDRVMLPYRFAAQALGLKVDWDAENQRVVIS